MEACSLVMPAQNHHFHAFFQLPAPWSPCLQPPSSFIHLVNTLKVKVKSFTTDWDLNPRTGTQTQPKPSLGLKPMGLGLELSQNPAWDLNPHDRDSVQFSCSVVSDSLQCHGLQHSRPPFPSPTLGVYSNSCPLSR